MLTPTSSSQPKHLVIEERVRQARLGFNFCLGFVSLSATVTLAGVILLLTGYLSQGGYATLGGLTSTAVGHRCMQLSRDANDRLDRIIETLSENESTEFPLQLPTCSFPYDLPRT
jgi:hypothetical protein